MLLLLHALACTSSAPDAPDNTVAEADTDTDTDSDTDTDTDTDTDSDTDTDQRRPIVIVMIGDGMGPEQLVAGSLYGWGEEGRLFIEQLPHQGEVVTSSLSGVTDSAASATAMSAGVLTWNGVVGLDRDLEPVETLVELSHRLGLSAGVVTTAHVSHATPAAFTAHEENRSNYTVIAEDQVSMLPDVMMGGGRQYFRPSSEKESVREDDGLIAPLEAAGCSLVYTSAELSAHDPAAPGCLVGLFAEEHLDYMVERTKDTTQPTLAELTLAALERLDTDEDGFFLMVEGARIDMAGHSNSIRRLVEEVVAFDEAVAVAASWAVDRDVLLLVTADHETGGLAVQSGGEAGELPEVTWEHPEHTNTRIRIFGQGGEAVAIDGQTVEHAWVHSLAQAHLEGSVFVPPVVASRVPDGRLSDLRHVAALQSVESNMGVGWNQLESLRLDATEEGLYIGVEGIFSRDLGSVVVLIDRDLGEGTGLSSLPGGITDSDGTLERVLRDIDIGAGVAGFGAEFAAISSHSRFLQLGVLTNDAGIRGLTTERGWPDDLWWMKAAITAEERTRTGEESVVPYEDEGIEMFIPFTSLYPDTKGVPPEGTVLGIAAMYVGEDGTVSNQLLPAAADSSTPSGLGGVVAFTLDSDGDGAVDGDQAPVTLVE